MKIYQWRSNLLEYELTPSTKLIGFVLSEYYRDGKKCYPGVRTLTEDAGFGSSNTTLKAIKELEENNLIKIEKYLKKGMSRETNSYVFVGVVSLSETLTETLTETSGETSSETSLSETEITESTEGDKKERTPPDSSHLISTPLYPPHEKKGVFKKNKKSGEEGKVGTKAVSDLMRSLGKSLKPEWTVDDVLKELDDHAENLIKQNSPGWDLRLLAGRYVKKINDKSRKPPKSVRYAFPAWCGEYTKGKRPAYQ